MTDQSLKPLPWQQDLWLDVTALVLQERLSHALLLAGPRGVGKRAFARALGAFMLCEARSGYACGGCRSCEQWLAGSHPNFMVLQRETDEKTGKQKRDISVEQVRKLIERLVLFGHYGQAKIVLIDPADDFNLSGANALLKTIEEPPPKTFMFLITERPQALPATLRSRCQRLAFGVPSPDAGRDWLAGQDVRDAENALRAARGAPLLALEWAGSGELERQREWRDSLQAVLAGKLDPVGAAARVAREDVPLCIDGLVVWLTERLAEQVRGKAPRPLPVGGLDATLTEAIEGRERLENNANTQLLLESLLILVWRLGRVAARAA